ncbi:hypothetical protein CHS0354_018358 [Potamilus streckersoni]|uniref:GMP synthase [glutamine-hydrolyzing] n=1 Tax=Potamilus streckersoni TaxID=2493646 RepID=A0AAE0WA65_9BIVA|nr:hypothetical protein CHS0354_018358 [Potamilus streckersoni]
MILILDFGSQYTQLIARRIRSFGVYTEIVPCYEDFSRCATLNPAGIVLSGGPDSVFASDAPGCDERIFSMNVPILGICYGYQYVVHRRGGVVRKGNKGEYGRTRISLKGDADIFHGVHGESNVWMSHSDEIAELPPGFRTVAGSPHSPHAASVSEDMQFIGLQFHPEVAHSECGNAVLLNFIERICRTPRTWSVEAYKDRKIRELREQIGSHKVICALSGGVDSSVTAALIREAAPEQIYCFYINNGLMRKGESEYVADIMRGRFGSHFFSINAEARFLKNLTGVSDPERKRKIIGETFIRVFEEEAGKISGAHYLAQGTLYPDVIESSPFKGPSATIKSHHNVGGLPEKMSLQLLEPLRELFKDETRELGLTLGLPPELIYRHPFPGPGLAIRIPGEITAEKLAILRDADTILLEEIRRAGLYNEIWQAFAVLLPVKSVGVMGDFRTYEYALSIRCVTSSDGMTADWFHFPHELLSGISNRIINEVKGINRVLYDITSKPPGTVEWENLDDILRKDAGCSSELDYIEQTSWILFLKYLDDYEDDRRTSADMNGEPYAPILKEEFAWKTWAAPKKEDGETIDRNKTISGDGLTQFVNERLFPYLSSFKNTAANADTLEYKIGEIFSELKNKLQSGYSLRDVIDKIDALRFRTNEEKHEMSSLYEDKIRNMGNAGRNGGEYYTPRPLIKTIVRVINPQIGHKVYDGAAGSCGFLCEAYEYMRTGRTLSGADYEQLQRRTFYGKEKKSLAYIIGIMNMILHGIETPNIRHTNTLSEKLQSITDNDRMDIVLANPPFGGSEHADIQKNFTIATGETAYLFLQHFIRILKRGGRCGIVIKNTFLSNTDNASISLRKELLENCNLFAVLEMPSGAFTGTGVKTVVLFFEKGKPTQKVWYYQFSPARNLGKTNSLTESDLTEFIALSATQADSDNSWTVDLKDIDKTVWDLTPNNPHRKDEADTRTPREILAEIETLDAQATAALTKIKELLI